MRISRWWLPLWIRGKVRLKPSANHTYNVNCNRYDLRIKAHWCGDCLYRRCPEGIIRIYYNIPSYDIFPVSCLNRVYNFTCRVKTRQGNLPKSEAILIHLDYARKIPVNGFVLTSERKCLHGINLVTLSSWIGWCLDQSWAGSPIWAAHDISNIAVTLDYHLPAFLRGWVGVYFNLQTQHNLLLKLATWPLSDTTRIAALLPGKLQECWKRTAITWKRN